MQRSLKLLTSTPVPSGGVAQSAAGVTRKLSTAVRTAQDSLRSATARAQAGLRAEQNELARLRPAVEAARPEVARLNAAVVAARSDAAAAEAEARGLLEELAALRGVSSGAPTARPRIL